MAASSSRYIANIGMEHVDALFSLNTPIPKLNTISVGANFLGCSENNSVSNDTKFADNTVAEDYYNSESSDEEEFNDAKSTVSSIRHLEQLEASSVCTDFPHVLPDDEHEERIHRIYRTYNFNMPYNTKLPIYLKREQILETIHENQVTVIVGSTGCGKTTQVAQYILDQHAREGRYCNIIITQPRRIAAHSVAVRVSTERQCAVGTLCGYQIGLDKKIGPDTLINYCTVGVFLKKLINERSLTNYTHVILDEVHERDKDTDFCLLLVRLFLRGNSVNTKVILMSATVEAAMFSDYFATKNEDVKIPAPIISCNARQFGVTTFYLEQIHHEIGMEELPMFDIGQNILHPSLFQVTADVLKWINAMEVAEFGITEEGFSSKRGSMLVFLPGEGEIHRMMQLLRSEGYEAEQKLWIITLYSRITSEEMNSAFDRPKPSMRKVILATNIAESSVTVTDIKYVIDFCLTKNMIWDRTSGLSSLQMEWASQAQCTQRQGRVGRVSGGWCFRLIRQSFYEELAPHTLPSMLRSSVESLVLQAKKLDLGSPTFILRKAISKPDLKDIKQTILKLKEVGALTLDLNECKDIYDGKLTFMGSVLADLPVDTQIGKMLLLGHVFGVLQECIIIAAGMTIKSIFSQPRDAEFWSYRSKFQWARKSFSDSIATLNAYEAWKKQKDSEGFHIHQTESSWCENRMLEMKGLRKLDKLALELAERLKDQNIIPAVHDPPRQRTNENVLILKIVIAGAFYPNYFLVGDVDEEVATRRLSGFDYRNTVIMSNLPQNKGLPYKGQIRSMFSEIQNQVSRNARQPASSLDITFDETRAYIHFPPEFNQSQKSFNAAVYFSLKMSKVNKMNTYVQEYDAESVRRYMDNVSVKFKSEQKQKGQLCTNRIVSLSNHQRRLARVPTSCRYKFIQIHDIVECGHFFATFHDRSASDLQAFEAKFNEFAVKPLSKGDLKVNNLCAAPFQGCFYRVKIIKIIKISQENGQILVSVFFVDYGYSSQEYFTALREYPREPGLDLPWQAHEFQISHIAPSPIGCPDGQWTEKTKFQFYQILQRATHGTACEVYSFVHGILRVKLYILDEEGEGSDVREIMIDEDIAIDWEESYASKQSAEEISKSPSFTMYDSVNIDRSEPYGTNLPFARSNSRFRLRGPDTPYEVQCHSMMKGNLMRGVIIEGDSINSILLREDPSDTHARMLVSGFISLTQCHSKLRIRETTLMPTNIPGLPAILSMIFCPTMELRASKDKTKMIGVLCGLGYRAKEGNALLPDRDIFISFDKLFKHKDIGLINRLRKLINIAIGENRTVFSQINNNALIEFHEEARFQLLELLQASRETILPTSSTRNHEWNLTPKVEVLEPENFPTQNDNLYPIHCGLKLQDDLINEQIKKNLEELKNASSMMLTEVNLTCLLCDLKLSTTRTIMIHLMSAAHKRMEAMFNKRTAF